MSDLLKRIGIIKVSDVLLRENPEDLLKIFNDILVTDVKINKKGVLEYKGLSKHFDVIEYEEFAPLYDVVVTSNEGKIESYKFIKKNYTIGVDLANKNDETVNTNIQEQIYNAYGLTRRQVETNESTEQYKRFLKYNNVADK